MQQLTERLEEAIAKQTVRFGYLSGFSTLLGQQGFLCPLPLLIKFKTINQHPCQFFKVNSQALFARAVKEIETRRVVVGINFGHAEWPIY